MSVVTTLPRRPLTVDDLDVMPDDGHRYELIDGTLIVSPGPELRHQTVQSELLRLLFGSCPADLFVLAAPTDTVLADDTVVQPDALVVRRSDLVGRKLTATPLLVVEILSPSTRLIDLNLKKARYQRAGVPSYWVVDPDPLRLTAWDLRDGSYVEVADVGRGDEWTAALPFAVTVRPGSFAD
ncbi:Uma2 family endonuclease [Nocardioides immobilis]|uniref:Uma2 family endonuclease n=1 Tax=Nocardioides immobilis TaxID=2049295 RepID=A0A417Y3I6_9ACTN|nr:Uma2 family endonuclease [Nocardioides immobilis]RHW27222.1 Uma2 family endonuclease [Nocardioides immobilis]